MAAAAAILLSTNQVRPFPSAHILLFLARLPNHHAITA
jgi:hypothetical protein